MEDLSLMPQIENSAQELEAAIVQMAEVDVFMGDDVQEKDFDTRLKNAQRELKKALYLADRYKDGE